MSKGVESVVDVNDVCRITEGTIITGEVTSSNDIRVDGTIVGTLFSTSKIVVGEGAKIEGNIVCGNLDFWGNIKGDIYVKDVLTLKDNSRVDGNLYSKKLQVEMGAQIEGSCKTISEDQFETMRKDVVTTNIPVNRKLLSAAEPDKE